MRDLFEDTEHGAFFTTAAGDPSLVLRMKEDYDGAEPAGNSIALLNLLRLAELTNRAEFQQPRQTRTLKALAPRIANQPVAVPQMLVALDYSLAPPQTDRDLAGDRPPSSCANCSTNASSPTPSTIVCDRREPASHH